MNNQAAHFILRYRIREFPADYAQALFERVVVKIAISTTIAFTVTRGVSAPVLSKTLPMTGANPPGLNVFMEKIRESSNAAATKYLGICVPPRGIAASVASFTLGLPSRIGSIIELLVVRFWLPLKANWRYEITERASCQLLLGVKSVQICTW